MLFSAKKNVNKPLPFSLTPESRTGGLTGNVKGDGNVIRSMTGFARARAENEAYAVDVEMRSVNHRYLDVKVRVPNSVSALELKIRERVASRLGRGKTDVNIRLKPKGESAYELEVDAPLVSEVVRSLRQLGSDLGVEGDIHLADLMVFGRGFNVREKDFSDAGEVWEALEPALAQALDDLERMRTAEGAELAADLTARLATMSEYLDRIEATSHSSRETRKRELIEKVNELELSALEPGALAMEVTRLVEKADIAEEITRFRSHFSLWNDTVTAGEPCGKKLDFIIQEMNREVNTIGSKCQDAAISEKVIAIKSELERVREQVQNLE
jgi:uncharacterized protein (TIGR00255 family)